jgi:hypothetical protein
MSKQAKRVPADEPTARMVGLWLEPGQGWRMAVVEVPRSVCQQHAVSVTEPELLSLTLAKAEESLARWAAGGGR